VCQSSSHSLRYRRDRRGPPQRGDTRGSKINGGKNKSNALPSTGLTNILGEHLEMLHKYHIFDSVIKQFYCQVFYYINTRYFFTCGGMRGGAWACAVVCVCVCDVR
jgi:hypothetical protein